MKIRYVFVNGEVSEIEVEETLGSLLLELDQQEANNTRAETRRHVSLSELSYEGGLFDAGIDVPEEVWARISAETLREALQKLPAAQRELIVQVYFQGRRPAEIARAEGVSRQSISERLQRALKKLQKYL